MLSADVKGAAETASVKAILRVRPPLKDENRERVIIIDGNQARIPNPRNTEQSLNYSYEYLYNIKAIMKFLGLMDAMAREVVRMKYSMSILPHYWII